MFIFLIKIIIHLVFLYYNKLWERNFQKEKWKEGHDRVLHTETTVERNIKNNKWKNRDEKEAIHKHVHIL